MGGDGRTASRARWSEVGPCRACDLQTFGWRAADGRPLHPDCDLAATLLSTHPVNERCPHCAAPVVEAWINGLLSRLDARQLDAGAARRALLDGREVFAVAPGPPVRLEPVGVPITFPADRVFLAGHHKGGTP
ncbi:hypothetical protein AGRA3207_000208 [Actinomadura graeca]|uniref:Uncharacterized protein n=1 Tax=Actinomadura graeca TaxID=2750812 RepID=A0ABX8QLU6_9ACTN|nr:hypothetical protein [Actinomadura graeca]QXJ19645.1 hypothetical protein AGRA3207_000208 [Actinomadura graeca]